MTNYNDRDSYRREINERREIQNPDNTVPTQVTQTTETVHHHTPQPNNVVYRDGYLQGRVSEQQLNEANQTARDNENAARGLLIGIIFTGLAALVIGAVFLLNQRSQTPVLIQRITPSASPSPSPSPSPQGRDRIIERDRIVPVPQTQPPQVNIAVPNSGQSTAPSTTQTAPGNSSSQTAPGTSSSQTAPSDSSAGGQSGTSGTGQTGTTGSGQ